MQRRDSIAVELQADQTDKWNDCCAYSNLRKSVDAYRRPLRKMRKVETLRHTEYMYRVGLTVLAGGPHYVGFPTAYPSYLFNVSFALVTIQISPSFSIPRQRHPPISLVLSLIIGKTMFNNDDPAFAVTVCALIENTRFLAKC